MYDFFIAPFEYLFLKRALVATFSLSLSCAPVGVFLVLRRMSLMGDALSHSILPGVAIGFLIGGLSLPLMSLGGLFAGILVALLAGLVSRWTHLQEDASFAGFFLISLALGVILVSTKGTNVDLMHVLFGSILAVDAPALILVGGVATCTLLVLAFIYRALILECFDPIFFRTVKGKGGLIHIVFLLLVVANLVVAFQIITELLAALKAENSETYARRFQSLEDELRAGSLTSFKAPQLNSIVLDAITQSLFKDFRIG